MASPFGSKVFSEFISLVPIQFFLGLIYVFIICSRPGNYVQLSTDGIPTLWLAYVTDPSDSGLWSINVHQNHANKILVKPFLIVF